MPLSGNTSKEHLQPAFKNASFWSNKSHWEWATKPNPREKASFLSENILPIQQSGQLQFIDATTTHQLSFDILYMNGHTEKQMLPKLTYKGKTIVFMADLLPTVGHIPLPYVMGYDTRPLLTIEEKQTFLNTAASNNYYLFLEHDIQHELCTVQHTEKGVRLKETFSFSDVFGH